jgi:hypothetical protein
MVVNQPKNQSDNQAASQPFLATSILTCMPVYTSQYTVLCLYDKVPRGLVTDEGFKPKSTKRFIEDQAFLWSLESASRPPLPRPLP